MVEVVDVEAILRNALQKITGLQEKLPYLGWVARRAGKAHAAANDGNRLSVAIRGLVMGSHCERKKVIQFRIRC
jgi:hypothetical protein